jgi:hypothetical protein
MYECYMCLVFGYKNWLRPAIKVANKAVVATDAANAGEPFVFPSAASPDVEPLPPWPEVALLGLLTAILFT